MSSITWVSLPQNVHSMAWSPSERRIDCFCTVLPVFVVISLRLYTFTATPTRLQNMTSPSFNTSVSNNLVRLVASSNPLWNSLSDVAVLNVDTLLATSSVVCTNVDRVCRSRALSSVHLMA